MQRSDSIYKHDARTVLKLTRVLPVVPERKFLKDIEVEGVGSGEGRRRKGAW